MAVHISAAVRDDLPQLATLAARTFPLACPPGTLDSDIAHFVATVLSESAFATYLDDGERVVLIARDPAPVGYAMLIRTPPTDPDVAASLTVTPSVEVSKLYVDPDAHGSGTAAALMDAAVDHTRELGWPALWLGVNQQNARALKFYGKNGFQRVGEKRFALGAVLHEDFVMQRVL